MSEAGAARTSLGSTALIRSPVVFWRTGDFGVVLLAPAMADPITIDGPGPQLWELLSVARTEDEIVQELAERFAADPSVIRRDVRPILDQLVTLGLARTE